MYTKDTVRLNVVFKDFDGNPIVPDDVKLIIYNMQNAEVETITVGIINSLNGQYFYDYVAQDSDFIFEFSGIYNSKPVLARQRVTTKFI